MSQAHAVGTSSIDPAEVEKFSRLADEWWDPKGKFAVLHKLNPVRLGYIRDRASAHFRRDSVGLHPFVGLRLLDIGCGGGLISEPMARLGAEVLGADASESNIKTARVHAERHGLAIDYRVASAEALARSSERFDVILNLEVVEHVADPAFFIATCAALLKPQGLMLISTINRTFKAFALAIIGAEYLLGWLPRGTHQWEKFITPGELAGMLSAAGLEVRDTVGVIYDPLADEWRKSGDTDVNFMVTAARPNASGQ